LDENGELQPHLAQSWEHSPDYLEWTYHLRTDARWSDGVPVTAHDVKFTLDLLSHPDVHYSVFDAVTVIADYTVKIRTGGGPGYLGWLSYLPKHVLEHLDPKKFKGWDFWLHPTVSAGPYRFVRYVPQTMMEFEANPNYFRGKPKIERLVLKFVGNAGLTELLSGNVDVVLFADPAQIPFVAKDPRFRVYNKVWHYAQAIYWKCDHPLFRDARVRRALTLAIDRRELLGVVNLPSDLPITDGVFTERQFLRRQFPEPLPYDPVQSRALLEAAGWQDRDGDGVREREGRPFRFTAIVRSDLDRMAVYVQAQLRQLGVQMEVQVLDTALVWDRFLGGDFEAIFHIHQPGLEAQRQYFGRDNPLGYQNPEVVRLTDQVTADPDELDRIYRALTEILRADLPVTRLVPWTGTTFAHRRVRGIAPYTVTMLAEDLGLENSR
jgi:peptide/nickel transport system substrate-binding protein